MRIALKISLKATAMVVLALAVTFAAVTATLMLPHPTGEIGREVQLTYDTAAHLDPAFSPNGKYIAFSSNRSGSFDIWVMDTRGMRQTRLTSMEGDEVLPKWDSEGPRIGFVWRHETFSDLCIIETATGSAKCLTSKSHVVTYAWSSDGKLVAYDDSGEGAIHLYDMLTGADSLFPFNVTAKEPAFGPRSDRLYFAAGTGKNVNIWSANLDGSSPRRLSWLGNDAKPQISPKGNRVLYLTNYSGYYEPRLVDIDGKNGQLLFDTPQITGYGFAPSPLIASGTIPRWSPNGTQILMVSSGDDSSGNLFVATLNVSVRVQPVSPTEPQEYYMTVFNRVPLPAPVLDAEWSPDGRSIVLVSNDRGSTQLFLFRIGSVAIGYEK
jgi:Tol biopolymer transport system component